MYETDHTHASVLTVSRITLKKKVLCTFVFYLLCLGMINWEIPLLVLAPVEFSLIYCTCTGSVGSKNSNDGPDHNGLTVSLNMNIFLCVNYALFLCLCGKHEALVNKQE